MTLGESKKILRNRRDYLNTIKRDTGYARAEIGAISNAIKALTFAELHSEEFDTFVGNGRPDRAQFLAMREQIKQSIRENEQHGS